MNLRKMKLARRRNVVMTNKDVFRRILLLPVGCPCAIIWWIASAVVAIALLADWPVVIDGRFAEFLLAMFALSILTPVLAFVYLFHCCDWNVAMIAYGWQATLILIMGRTTSRWVQMVSALIMFVQSLVAMYGLAHSI